MTSPFVPFRVKHFPLPADSYGRAISGELAQRMNDWFTELAKDIDYEYDIRQILPMKTGGVMVFYEVAPAGVAPSD